MSNTIIIELHEEDRKRLDSITCLLGTLIGELKADKPDLKIVTPQEAPEQLDLASEHPAGEASPHGLPEPVAEPVADPELPKYTKADILAKVQKLATPGHPKREEAKAIVKSYGAKVSDIPEDKYGEVMDKLTALEG